ncbi:KxYKxGKxW signal peptide domain-containing protein [Limosilactobacillus mucosae]
MKRFGKETETDRSCRVKMYKAGKNWLTSCQFLPLFFKSCRFKAGCRFSRSSSHRDESKWACR